MFDLLLVHLELFIQVQLNSACGLKNNSTGQSVALN